MRLIELFGSKAVKLGAKAKSKAQIIDQLVELQATHGNITDKEAYKKAVYARGCMVTAPSLAVVALVVGSVVGALVLSLMKKDKR